MIYQKSLFPSSEAATVILIGWLIVSGSLSYVHGGLASSYTFNGRSDLTETVCVVGMLGHSENTANLSIFIATDRLP